jgi:hypothetical protein
VRSDRGADRGYTGGREPNQRRSMREYRASRWVSSAGEDVAKMPAKTKTKMEAKVECEGEEEKGRACVDLTMTVAWYTEVSFE